MSEFAPSLEGVVAEATILVHEIEDLDLASAPPLWRLADLTASVVPTAGGDRKSIKRKPLAFDLAGWAEQIGWTALGRRESTLAEIVKVSRSWPEEYRVEDASIWQHREALSHFGDLAQASEWLAANAMKKKKERLSVRDVTRSGVMGTGPIFDAIRLLMRARKGILRVPAILAEADALGTEPNFDQLRAEVSRLKKGMAYLDRYLADETTIDMAEIQAGLDRILKEAAS